METLKDIFVSYETAKRLKAIGFDTKCIVYYYDDKELHLFEKGFKITTDEEFEKFVIAPSYEQVFKWFREKGFNMYISFLSESDLHEWVVYINRIVFHDVGREKTYEKARETLILKLIEIYENTTV